QPNVGKSTLGNKLLNKYRILVSNIPGTTRNNITSSTVYNNQNYEITDSIGINKNNFSKDKKYLNIHNITNTVLSKIKYTNIVLHVICLIDKRISHYDLSLIRLIVKKNTPIIIVINKCDIYSNLNEIKFNVINQLSCLKFIKIIFVSALYDQKFNSLFKLINRINKLNNLKFKTKYINSILNNAVKKYPPTYKNRLIKLKYAYISNYNPIVINIHGTNVLYLNKSYKKYLKNFFQRTLNILGTSIYIKIINKNR
ncbi:MAG: GTP-binding protein, partial [Candidatus Lightella neohaematopini]|nr:GTP-binding protein [Candidatus Lightella neohaematopini]